MKWLSSKYFNLSACWLTAQLTYWIVYSTFAIEYFKGCLGLERFHDHRHDLKIILINYVLTLYPFSPKTVWYSNKVRQGCSLAAAHNALSRAYLSSGENLTFLRPPRPPELKFGFCCFWHQYLATWYETWKSLLAFDMPTFLQCWET